MQQQLQTPLLEASAAITQLFTLSKIATVVITGSPRSPSIVLKLKNNQTHDWIKYTSSFSCILEVLKPYEHDVSYNPKAKTEDQEKMKNIFVAAINHFFKGSPIDDLEEYQSAAADLSQPDLTYHFNINDTTTKIVDIIDESPHRKTPSATANQATCCCIIT